jgi:hypothetical protein
MPYEISPSTFARLQRHAVALIDIAPDSVINRVLDFYESHHGAGVTSGELPAAITAKSFHATSPPDLTHTKVLSAKFNGTTLAKGANWNGLLRQAIRTAKSHSKTHEDLKSLIIVNFVLGRKQGEGYEYIPEADVSVQGQDANGAWRGALHIAQQLSCPIEAVFIWRHKEKAAFPGETGRLVFG